jgi:3-hydroxybutyryl-CoA dehydrogenase
VEIKKVGVVGCGTMGSGIVQICAQSGYQVVVSEINEEFLNKGLKSIDSTLSRNVEKGRMTQEDKDAVISRIKGTTQYEDFSECDLMIEVAIEKMDLKKEIFSKLDKICPEHAILSTNTSCLSVMDIAMVTSRPEKVLGLHFFNPVPVMQLLEIVNTITTSEDTLNTSKAFGESVGKTIVVTKDAPGFIVNRLLIPFILNAIRLYETGIASKEDIDAGMRLGANHPMGPLALADLIGLDTVQLIAGAVYEEIKDTAFISPVLLNKMVTAGRLGRKTGEGFYSYK